MRTDETALFIIDMQNDFVLPASPWCIAGAKRTIPRIVYVLKTFREKGRPVFHLVREYRADGSDVEAFRYQEFVDGTPCAISQTTGCDIVKELQPQKHEYRIVKKRFSGFMNTELDLLDSTRLQATAYPESSRQNCKLNELCRDLGSRVSGARTLDEALGMLGWTREGDSG